MPKFTYLGLTDEEKKRRLEAAMKGLVPPEQRGQPPYYHITKEDEEEEKEAKRERTKKWLAARRAEIAKKIDLMDSKIGYRAPGWIKDEPEMIVFPKGKAVEISEDHPLFAKLRDLSDGVVNKPKHEGHIVMQHKIFKMEPDKKG